jgi:hypothetical protein
MHSSKHHCILLPTLLQGFVLSSLPLLSFNQEVCVHSETTYKSEWRATMEVSEIGCEILCSSLWSALCVCVWCPPPWELDLPKERKMSINMCLRECKMFDESSWFLSHYYARVFLSLSELRASPDQLLSSFGTSNASQPLERAWCQKINMEGYCSCTC